MDYEGKPLKVSEAWPDSSGHKVLLDRIRKMDRAGWLVLDKLNPLELDLDELAERMFGDYPLRMVYLAMPATAGLVRIRHLADRIRHTGSAAVEVLESRMAAAGLS